MCPGYTDFVVACHIIRSDKVAALMYKAALNQVMMMEHSQFDLWAPVNFNLSLLGQIMALREFTFAVPGKCVSNLHKRRLWSDDLGRFYSYLW